MTAGGALLYAGCYTAHAVRFVVGSQPMVTAADTEAEPGRAEGRFRAELAWDGASQTTGRVEASLIDWRLAPLTEIVVEGTGYARFLVQAHVQAKAVLGALHG